VGFSKMTSMKSRKLAVMTLEARVRSPMRELGSSEMRLYWKTLSLTP